MDSATVLSICIGLAIVACTGYGLYVSFGPPSRQLSDPFDDHDD